MFTIDEVTEEECEEAQEAQDNGTRRTGAVAAETKCLLVEPVAGGEVLGQPGSFNQDHKIRVKMRAPGDVAVTVECRAARAVEQSDGGLMQQYEEHRRAVIEASQYGSAVELAIAELTARGLVHGRDYMYECVILDTGCQLTLVHCSWEQFMNMKAPSRASITGFAGEAYRQNANYAGTVYTKFISEWEQLEGSLLKVNANSVPGLAGNLFSINKWYGKDTVDKRCIMYSDSAGESYVKIRRGSSEVVMPCRYCTKLGHWIMHTVVGGDQEMVKAAGECVQRHIRADSFNMQLNARVRENAQISANMCEAVDEDFLLTDDDRDDMVVDVSALQVSVAMHMPTVEAAEQAPKMMFSAPEDLPPDLPESKQMGVAAVAAAPATECMSEAMEDFTCKQHGVHWNAEVMAALNDESKAKFSHTYSPCRTGRFRMAERPGVISYQDDHMYHSSVKWGPGPAGPRRKGQRGLRFPADKYWSKLTAKELADILSSRRWDERNKTPMPHFSPEVETREWAPPSKCVAVSRAGAGRPASRRAVCWHDVLKQVPNYAQLMDTRVLTEADMQPGSPFLRAFGCRVPMEGSWNLEGELGTACRGSVVRLLASLPNPEQYVGRRVAAAPAQREPHGPNREAFGAGVVEAYRARGPAYTSCANIPVWKVRYDNGVYGWIDGLVLMCAVVLGGGLHEAHTGREPLLSQSQVAPKLMVNRAKPRHVVMAAALAGAAITRSEARRRKLAGELPVQPPASAGGGDNAPVDRTAGPRKLEKLDVRIGDPKQWVGHVFYKFFKDTGLTYAGKIKLYKPRLQLWEVWYDQHALGASEPDNDWEELDQHDILRLLVDEADKPDLAKHKDLCELCPMPVPMPPAGGLVEEVEEEENVADGGVEVDVPGMVPEPEPGELDLPDESALRGAKAGMHPRERAMSQRRMHERHGHTGECPNCRLCDIFRGKLRNIPTKVDPHVEVRPGYRWHMDVICWNRRNRHGEKYTCAMRCEATGFICFFNCQYRSELPRGVHDMVMALRNNPLYKGHPYELVQTLRLDLEGAWNERAKEWKKVTDELGIKCEYADPQDKRSNSRAEGLMRILETTTKSCLAQTSMGYEWWGEAMAHAVLIRNCYPLTTKISSSDGDTIRPMEELSMAPGGSAKVSRRMIDHILHHCVCFGQLAVIFNGKVKGSNIEKSKARFGICIGMLGDMPRWWCPYTQHEFKSKQYVEYQMLLGVSAKRMIGLDETPMTKIAIPRLHEDHCEDVKFNVTIENFAEMIGDEVPSMLQYDGITRHRGIKNVMCEITDGKGNTYTADEHGEVYMKLLQEAMDSGNPTLEHRLPRAHMLAKLDAKPSWFARQDVKFYKKFPTGDGEFELRMGRVKTYRTVSKTWTIVYDTVDSSGLAQPPSDDHEVFDKADMLFYIVDAEHAPKPVHANVTYGVRHSELLLARMQLRAAAELREFCDPSHWDTRSAVAHLIDEYAPRHVDYHGLNAAVAEQPPHVQHMFHCMVSRDGPGNVPEREHITASQWPNQRETLGGALHEQTAACYETVDGETVLDVLKAMRIPTTLHKCCYMWWGCDYGPRSTGANGGVKFTLPWKATGKCNVLPRYEQTQLEAGKRFPIPTGEVWTAMSHDYVLVTTERDHAHRNLKLAEHEAYVAEMTYRASLGETRAAKAYKQPAGRDNPEHEEQWPAATYGHAALKDLLGPDGRIKGCRSITEAAQRPDHKRWLAAVHKELEAFVRLKVIDQGHTMDEIRARGITSGAIPWCNGLTVKYGPDGMLAKYKSRRHVDGSPRHAHYGEHFSETFSPSPNPATTKIMMALCVLLGLKRRCCDIHTAYLHAECLPGEQCPVRNPPGERQYRNVRLKDGRTARQELFGIMMRYIYGMPSSDRRYAQMLNRFLLECFGEDGWTIKKSKMDPCLYIMTYPRARYPDRMGKTPLGAERNSEGGSADGPRVAAATAAQAPKVVRRQGRQSPADLAAVAAMAAKHMAGGSMQAAGGVALGPTLPSMPTAAAGSVAEFPAPSTDFQYSERTRYPAKIREPGNADSEISRSARVARHQDTQCSAADAAATLRRREALARVIHGERSDASAADASAYAATAASATGGARARPTAAGSANGTPTGRVAASDVQRKELEDMAAEFNNSERGTIYMVVHTDDCDMIGSSDAAMGEVVRRLDERFGVDEGDPTHMLGLERTLSEDGTELELTQTGFVDQMVEEWSGYCTDKYRTTPLPSGTFVTRVPAGSVDEHTWAGMEAVGKAVTKRGYRKVIGSLLWLARSTMPELLVCVSMLSKVMCQPTEEAWRLCMWCVEYCRGQRQRGLKFSKGGCGQPVCYYDSSNRADVTSGKAQHGHAVFLADGPVVVESKVHKHVGMSASHNEWMGLRWAAMSVQWVRELLKDMGLGGMVTRPTPCNGDNDATLRFAWEDMLTPGNKYYLQEYYFVKEMVHEDVISPRNVHTKLNYADPLTKVQTKGVLEETRGGLCGMLPGGLPWPAPPPPDVHSWR